MTSKLKLALLGLGGAASLVAASAPATAAVVFDRITIQNAQGTWLQVAEVQIWSGANNVALAGAASATGGTWDATSTPDKAIDGNTGGGFYTDTIFHNAPPGDGSAILTISFAQTAVDSIKFFGRTDCCSERDTYTYSLFNGTDLIQTGFVDARSGPAVVALPELSTWAMMLSGFGLIGWGLRRRRRQGDRVAFA